ncbi:H-NS histone family protein [Parapusillimonas sp. JC17]|uniref:H-NS histone family protein n=1 Tax=Parapusillimonas sp. JC17 TaxID=3445768 RepID=UPI003F9F4859
MAQSSYTTIKQKIEKEILKLQKQAQALRGPVITSLIKTMREYDITPDDIAAAYARKNTRGGAKKAAPAAAGAKRSVPVKYKHPETGESWTGRGKAPRWLTSAEAEGASRDSFLVK